MSNLDDYWNRLIEYGVSEQTLSVVTNINGYTMETLEDILYATFGYNSFEQMEDDDDV